MSDKKNYMETIKKYKKITKLSGMDYFLIILSTILLLILYVALYYKWDILCGYILPIGYMIAAVAFLVVFIKQVISMNKSMNKPEDEESGDSAPTEK